jgi:methionyl-tRNA formyltransferase
LKIVFFGTSEVGLPILEALIGSHEVIQVITSPDALVGRKQELTPTPIAVFAEQHQLPLQKPATVKNNPEFIEFLRGLGADIFIVVSYGKILPLELLTIPPLQTLNVHFSLLPAYRGAAPIQYALLNGEIKTGTSIFVLDELVDHGPLLAQDSLDIEPEDNFATLAPKLAELSAKLLIKILPDYTSGDLVPKEQNHEAATNTGLIKKEDGRINWEHTATQIHNQQRAFIVWPGIWTMWDEKVLKILDCQPTETIEEIQPGQIHDQFVACGGGSQLELITVQLEGGNPTPIQDFLRGYPAFTRGILK